MNRLPDGFAECSLTALPFPERAALVRVLEEGAHARAMRLRPGAALPEAVERVPWAADAYYIDADSRAGASPLHDAGAYYLQEPSAMAPATVLDVHPGQRVLDLCAAPGGKSTQIAALLRGEGVLVANEIVPARARVLSQNIERMGIANAIVTNETPEKLAAKWGPIFDRVLVDAPCSGEGMFRRDAEARAQWTPESPGGCAARQQRILASAAGLVAEGGLLVYSTCTFNEMENEGVVRGFLRASADFTAEAFSLPGVGASVEGGVRLWPHRLRGEGHFVARFRKRGAHKPSVGPRPSAQLSEVLPGLGIWRGPGILRETGDRTWLLPPEAPPLAGIRALRTGLGMASRKGKTILPDHALSHALPPSAFARVLEVDETRAAAFLRGETLEAEGGKGFALVTYRGYGLGFGKCVDGTLKNHLPKGLRRS